MKKVWTLALVLLTLSSPTRASPDAPWTWEEVRFGGIMEQGLDNSCGLASLLTIMRTHFGDERFDEQSLLKKYMDDASEAELALSMRNGLSLLELEKLTQSIGYTTAKKVLTLGELERLISFVPVLVYLEIGKLRHFTVVRGVNKESVLLGDPSRGNVEYSRDEFMSEWKTLKDFPEKTGVALIIVRNEGVFAQKLLKEPASYDSASFIEIRRQMIK
ncbi:MAG: cysteine peptidase family C39 domain-containing protein [bacterium]|nr:cysteine peptidase family C39 domain-containing protein [bacterium]